MLQSRADVATELLSELNDDVNGDFVEEVSAFVTNICSRHERLIIIN